MLSTVEVEVLQRPRYRFPFVVDHLGLERPVVEDWLYEADRASPLVPDMVPVAVVALMPPIWRYLIPRQSTGV